MNRVTAILCVLVTTSACALVAAEDLPDAPFTPNAAAIADTQDASTAKPSETSPAKPDAAVPTLPETVVEGTNQPAAPSGENFPSPPADESDSGRGQDLLRTAESASQGSISRDEILMQPRLRTGEILENVPGLIVTQHSGSGKANQYFLRGFNLDHGTDFSAYIDNVPINLPTNAHGQGYLDLNFLMPELVEKIDFRKGPYYADVGDFSSAGTTNFHLVNSLPQGIARFEIGENDWVRFLGADSWKVRDFDLLGAIEVQKYNGPWEVPEDVRKINGLAKISCGNQDAGCSLTGFAYHNQWNSTDQIPLRAVESGEISPLGAIDPTDGGNTYRYGLNLQAWHAQADSRDDMNVYVQWYGLQLFSDFTYFLDDPVNGDQFEQEEQRFYCGINYAHSWENTILGTTLKQVAGVQFRDDDLPMIALRKTKDRQVLSTTTLDSVQEQNLGLYYTQELELSEKVRPNFGMRENFFRFAVDSESQPVNSGVESGNLFCPKCGLALGPWDQTDFYINWGVGLHSNDARGTTLVVDPTTGLPTSPVTPLVESRGGEIGMRSRLIPGLNTTVALWYLDLDSELVFSGDAGTTEASRPSHRQGVEWTNFYTVNPWLTMNADFAWTSAEFTEFDPVGQFIPGSLNKAFSIGPTVKFESGFYSTFRYRFFGPRPLIEDGSVFSGPTTVCDLGVGYKKNRLNATVDILNIFNSDDHDIDYYYASRLPGEPVGGVNDIHFHPVEPRTVRCFVTWSF